MYIVQYKSPGFKIWHFPGHNSVSSWVGCHLRDKKILENINYTYEMRRNIFGEIFEMVGEKLVKSTQDKKFLYKNLIMVNVNRIYCSVGGALCCENGVL